MEKILENFENLKLQDKEEQKLSLDDIELLNTVGVGSFGGVRVVKKKNEPHAPYALKMLKKSEIIGLRQVEHLKDEKKILSMLNHPFIVSLKGTF